MTPNSQNYSNYVRHQNLATTNKDTIGHRWEKVISLESRNYGIDRVLNDVGFTEPAKSITPRSKLDLGHDFSTLGTFS